MNILTKKTFVMMMSLFLIIGLLLSACGTDSTSSGNDKKNENENESSPNKTALLNMASIPTGTSWYLYMSESANVMNKYVDGLNISVQETGGTVANAKELKAKKVDIAFIETFVAHESYNGTGRFADSPNPDLRVFNYIAPSSMQWAVTQSSGITKFEELNGKKFNPSSVGGGGEYITELVFNILDVKPEFHRAKLSDAAEMVKNNQLVGFSYNGTPPIPIFTEVHSSQPIRILSLSDEQVQKVRKEMPFLLRQMIPENTYDGSPEAQTLGLYMGMAVNKELDTELVYEMAKAFYENIGEVGKVFTLANESKAEETVEFTTVPLHAGVVKYFKEIGINVPDELIPSEYKE